MSLEKEIFKCIEGNDAYEATAGIIKMIKELAAPIGPQREKIKYEIHIGKKIEFGSGKEMPNQIRLITEKEFELISLFASTRKDENLNTIYRLNDCEFSVITTF